MKRDKSVFSFKQFRIKHENSPMKVGTDGVLLGAWASHPNPKYVLDIGCGCGLISLMLAQRFPEAAIEGIDIYPPAVEESRFNALQSPFHDRLNFFANDFNAFGTDKTYDLIVSNPPFFFNALRADSPQRQLARHQDTLRIDSLIERATKLIAKPEGKIALILPPDAMQTAMSTAEASGLHLHRICMVSSRENEKPVRIMAEWTNQNLGEPIVSSMHLYDEEGQRSEVYSHLTADFYL